MKLTLCSAKELLRALTACRHGADTALELLDADEGPANDAIATTLRGKYNAGKGDYPAADLIVRRKRCPRGLRLKIKLFHFSLCAGVPRSEQGVNELSRAQNTLSDYLSGLGPEM
ncbi:hypothetical protein HCH_01513 [Hahella chejuensis KCTC 2396]|uniref:Uncharacterized protein n=1 Tax=Hahella chejuensis (strain KCTC 2396) TaxID=349521 RepID=Q2SLV3_HAHCH|nr:hypothetical protein [Hahella chejuensis]ABC28371.1 hypothetical protein HCH_01513 [Hahella chejuensis KCTC 2396]